MESVMNFLAENYIWFFVAAGVLLFALIGFLIDSKNKSKQEFKGDSVENNEEPVVNTNVDPMQTIDLGVINNVEDNNNTANDTVEQPEIIDLSEEVQPEANVVPEDTIIFENNTDNEPQDFETPIFEERVVNPELETNNENISFGVVPEITKEDMTNKDSSNN